MTLLQRVKKKIEENEKLKIVNNCFEENITNGKFERWSHLVSLFVIPKNKLPENQLDEIFKQIFLGENFSFSSVAEVRTFLFEERLGGGGAYGEILVEVDDIPGIDYFLKDGKIPVNIKIEFKRAIFVYVFSSMEQFQKYRPS